ncbi:MAG: hypothetical protein GY834_15685 [Bacteroidetes bacterium]|nr:hypothetical protein [Bacteroidota bacterium]
MGQHLSTLIDKYNFPLPNGALPYLTIPSTVDVSANASFDSIVVDAIKNRTVNNFFMPDHFM